MKLDPKKDMEIDEHNLGKEFRRMSSLLNRYSQEKNLLEQDLELAELELSELKADLHLKWHKKEYKATEIKMEIVLDPQVKELHREILDLKREIRTYEGYMVSLKTKKDMLIQLGADARKEH